MNKIALHWQILIAILLAALAGWLSGPDTAVFGVPLVSAFDFLGTIFINALKMLIVPLIGSSIIVGVAGIGGGANIGRLGGRTLLLYATTTLAAILVGLVLVNLVQPGIVDGKPVRDLLALDTGVESVQASVGDKGAGDVVEIFTRSQ